jgi:Fe-Mn family superoxide dismutase
VRTPLDFPQLRLGLPGLSLPSTQHHVELYRRYVEQFNQRLGEPLWRWGVEAGRLLNAIRLHELYFGALAPGGGRPSRELEVVARLSFQGGFQSMLMELREAAIAVPRPGWALLLQSDTMELRVVVAADHAVGVPADHHVVAAIDLWEHAYCLDYATEVPPYVDAVLANLDWAEASSRLHIRGQQRDAGRDGDATGPQRRGDSQVGRVHQDAPREVRAESVARPDPDRAVRRGRQAGPFRT